MAELDNKRCWLQEHFRMRMEKMDRRKLMTCIVVVWYKLQEMNNLRPLEDCGHRYALRTGTGVL